ncbi:MAG TPA: 4'-phosphopantetheinyl transferase superfamily protein [Burkholderiaceae bacterium]|jgi:enterobactin synthetase component D|nr:4'-phosphopantetheinyl transferase superfamily protein [Burkholderiaceae bacterium]
MSSLHVPLTEALRDTRPDLRAAIPTLFRAAPHPPIDTACGIALDMTALAAWLDAGQVAALVPIELARAIPRRQLSFVAGRLCAEEALRRIGQAGPVGRGAVGEPLWPAQVVGSITHTDQLACALVAPATPGRRGLGIDSERIDDEASLQAVLALCCTPRERDVLFTGRRTPQEERRTATIVFALKEAFYKAIHPTLGRFVDFGELEVGSIDLGSGSASMHPTLPEWPRGAPLTGRFTFSDLAVHAVVDLAPVD